jgi:glycosyltransferase involved in cell wall biosynthesis
MKVGIVSVSDGRLGDGLRIRKFKQFLGEMGFEVVVLNPFSCIRTALGMQGASRPMASAVRFWSKMKDIPIVRNSAVQIGLYKAVTRILSYELFRMVKREKVDLLQVETQAAAELTLHVKEKLEIPIFLDIHSGSYIDEADEQIHPPAAFLNYMKERETEAILSSDEVFVVSNEMKQLVENGHNSVNTTLVPNGADVHPDLMKNYGSPLQIAYAGNFSYWERLEDYFDAARMLGNSTYEYFLLGDGVMREKMLSIIERDQVPVKYLGYLPRNEYKEFMGRMHVGVAPNADEKSRIYCCPIKLFEYLSFGLPVICAHLGEWPQLLTKHDCGIVVPPENPSAIADAIQIYEDEDVWWRHSENGRRLIRESYSWEKIIKGLQPIYNKYLS